MAHHLPIPVTFVPGNSWFHRLHPTPKLIWAVGALVLAFSTTGIVQQERQGPTIDVLSVDEEGLYPLFASAAFAAEEAVFDGLLAAGETERLKALPQEGWPEAVCAMLQNTR